MFNCVRIVDYVTVKVKRLPSFARQKCRNKINPKLRIQNGRRNAEKDHWKYTLT